MGWQRNVYRGLAVYNDAKAIRKGPKAVGRRVGRRIYGKITGRLARRLFG